MIEATCSGCGTVNRLADADVPAGAKLVNCTNCSAPIHLPAKAAAGKLPPAVPPVEDGRPSYTAMAWTPAGEFEGHVHLIRADLYSGQPCEPNGGPYTFIPLIGYYECLRP